MIGALRGHSVRMRLCAFALAATTLAFAFPAAALGNTEQLVTANVKKNDGFRMSFSVYSCPPCLGATRSLDVLLDKRSGRGIGGVVQDSEYIFFSGLRFRGSKKLGTAHVSGTFADKRGSINMNFAATGRAKKVPVPPGCRGTPGEERKGMLRGSFDLKADRLGAEKQSSVRATLERPPKITCYYTPRLREGSRAGVPLAVLGSEPRHRYLPGGVRRGSLVVVSKRQGKGAVTETIESFRSGHGFSIGRTYTVYAPRADYTFSRNLSSATVKGYGGIKGTANYTGTAVVPPTGGVERSHGTLKGNVSVYMAAMGTVEPLASSPVRAVQVAN